MNRLLLLILITTGLFCSSSIKAQSADSSKLNKMEKQLGKKEKKEQKQRKKVEKHEKKLARKERKSKHQERKLRKEKKRLEKQSVSREPAGNTGNSVAFYNTYTRSKQSLLLVHRLH